MTSKQIRQALTVLDQAGIDYVIIPSHLYPEGWLEKADGTPPYYDWPKHYNAVEQASFL